MRQSLSADDAGRALSAAGRALEKKSPLSAVDARTDHEEALAAIEKTARALRVLEGDLVDDVSARAREARLSGASTGGYFGVQGVELARDSGVIGAGWTVLAAGRLELAADYQLLLNQNLTEHSFGLQVRASW